MLAELLHRFFDSLVVCKIMLELIKLERGYDLASLMDETDLGTDAVRKTEIRQSTVVTGLAVTGNGLEFPSFQFFANIFGPSALHNAENGELLCCKRYACSDLQNLAPGCGITHEVRRSDQLHQRRSNILRRIK